MATQNPNPNDQDQRQGGYGGSTGGQDPQQGAGQNPQRGAGQDPQRGAGQETGSGAASGTGATGREDAVTSSVDSDEALGNRTGAYGGNPPSTSDQPDGATGADQ